MYHWCMVMITRPRSRADDFGVTNVCDFVPQPPLPTEFMHKNQRSKTPGLFLQSL